eukprot:460594-Pelagomonas_calceolata.AAC.1
MLSSNAYHPIHFIWAPQVRSHVHSHPAHKQREMMQWERANEFMHHAHDGCLLNAGPSIYCSNKCHIAR